MSIVLCEVFLLVLVLGGAAVVGPRRLGVVQLGEGRVDRGANGLDAGLDLDVVLVLVVAQHAPGAVDRALQAPLVLANRDGRVDLEDVHCHLVGDAADDEVLDLVALLGPLDLPPAELQLRVRVVAVPPAAVADRVAASAVVLLAVARHGDSSHSFPADLEIVKVI